jgi:hypothetical protein
MTIVSLSSRTSLFHVIHVRLAKLISTCATGVSRAFSRLRPHEWFLLLVGAVALIAFLFVLWGQPVSRR